MTDIEIIEGNKLIAEFMGYEVFAKHCVRIYDNMTTTIELWAKYDTSWDWLMPVVQKICDIDNQADDVLFYKMTRAKLSIFSTSIFCTINATHERVVQFIKWYNTNK